MAKRYRTKRNLRNSKRRKTGGRSFKARRRMRAASSIVPPSKLVKLRYAAFITLDPAAGTSADRHIFRANSCFDPEQTGAGHQPLGFDQWAIFYDNYTVVGAKITVKFMSQDPSPSTGSSLVGIVLTDDTTSLPSTTTIVEQPNSRYAMMTGGEANQKRTVTKTFSAKKFFGLQSIKDNRATIGAAVTADPSEEAFFSVYAASYDSAATVNPAELKCMVTLDYIVMFTERKVLAAS